MQYLHIAWTVYISICRNAWLSCAEFMHVTHVSMCMPALEAVAEYVCEHVQLSSTGQPAVSLITQHPPGVRPAICR